MVYINRVWWIVSIKMKTIIQFELTEMWDDECGGKSATLNAATEGALNVEGALYEYPCGLAIAASTKHDITMNGFIVSLLNFFFAQIKMNHKKWKFYKMFVFFSMFSTRCIRAQFKTDT